ncbi:hypothetical protein BDQ17DRAFT_1347756 [Cyathus striatus]|nr:hypothetical protein BDQ17DRAFT_1347756 [Cyathus striatus]
MVTDNTEDYEDILRDSLEFLGGNPVIDNDVIKYGPIQLTVAPKACKANTLLADHLFSPAIYLAERIETGKMNERNRTVLELGAGTALPSLLLSVLPNPPCLIVVTDYPDDGILGNLKRNVERNRVHFERSVRVELEGYDWGTDTTHLLKMLPTGATGYDTLILSDLVHFHSSHQSLVSSITALLANSPSSRVHIGAGVYTNAEVCDNFLSLGRQANLVFDEILPTETERMWRGTLEVSGLDVEALALRKSACRYWVGRWADY